MSSRYTETHNLEEMDQEDVYYGRYDLLEGGNSSDEEIPFIPKEEFQPIIEEQRSSWETYSDKGESLYGTYYTMMQERLDTHVVERMPHKYEKFLRKYDPHSYHNYSEVVRDLKQEMKERKFIEGINKQIQEVVDEVVEKEKAKQEAEAEEQERQRRWEHQRKIEETAKQQAEAEEQDKESLYNERKSQIEQDKERQRKEEELEKAQEIAEYEQKERIHREKERKLYEEKKKQRKENEFKKAQEIAEKEQKDRIRIEESIEREKQEVVQQHQLDTLDKWMENNRLNLKDIDKAYTPPSLEKINVLRPNETLWQKFLKNAAKFQTEFDIRDEKHRQQQQVL